LLLQELSLDAAFLPELRDLVYAAALHRLLYAGLEHPPLQYLFLQDLSLDAAFLPELRELVYAAARGNIPSSGPGALTGLCLLDQAVTSAAQLAALSQLSSLAGEGLGFYA
jgi:hypothetical protein